MELWGGEDKTPRTCHSCCKASCTLLWLFNCPPNHLGKWLFYESHCCLERPLHEGKISWDRPWKKKGWHMDSFYKAFLCKKKLLSHFILWWSSSPPHAWANYSGEEKRFKNMIESSTCEILRLGFINSKLNLLTTCEVNAKNIVFHFHLDWNWLSTECNFWLHIFFR